MAIQCRSTPMAMVAVIGCVAARRPLTSVQWHRKYKIHVITPNTITACGCSNCFSIFLISSSRYEFSLLHSCLKKYDRNEKSDLRFFLSCRVTSSMTGHNWLYYSYATFQLYSRYAPLGTPVQYGDVVGFKYPYYSNSAWLSYYSSYFYPRSCSSNSKYSCARVNSYTGFQIFKKL